MHLGNRVMVINTSCLLDHQQWRSQKPFSIPDAEPLVQTYYNADFFFFYSCPSYSRQHGLGKVNTAAGSFSLAFPHYIDTFSIFSA